MSALADDNIFIKPNKCFVNMLADVQLISSNSTIIEIIVKFYPQHYPSFMLQQFEIKPATKINRRMKSGTGFYHFYLWHG
jgi:hypothetical protein